MCKPAGRAGSFSVFLLLLRAFVFRKIVPVFFFRPRFAQLRASLFQSATAFQGCGQAEFPLPSRRQILSLQFQLSIKDRSKRRLLFNILDKHSHESRIYKFYDIYTIKHVYKKKQTKNHQFLTIFANKTFVQNNLKISTSQSCETKQNSIRD